MKTTQTIPLCKPLLDEAELHAIGAVLGSGMLVQGKEVADFEDLCAKRVAQAHAVACSSGTAALYMALKALGIGEGDEVLCPALSWPSPAHAIILCQATPVFVDVRNSDWNLDPKGIAAALTKKSKAAIVIDQFGMPADYDAICDALGDLPIIEDAACSLGSHYQGKACGSLGTIATLSFHPRKVITTAEGGMCLTDLLELAETMRQLRNHGQSAPGRFEQAAHNFRLSEIAASMGKVQMNRLDIIIEKRRAIALGYKETLPELGWQKEDALCQSNYQTMGIVLDEQRHPSPAKVIDQLRNHGIQAGPLSYCLADLPSVRRHSRIAGQCTVAKRIAKQGLAIPLFVQMSQSDQKRVINALQTILLDK